MAYLQKYVKQKTNIDNETTTVLQVPGLGQGNKYVAWLNHLVSTQPSPFLLGTGVWQQSKQKGFH